MIGELFQPRVGEWPFRPLAVYARGRRYFDVLAPMGTDPQIVANDINKTLGISVAVSPDPRNRQLFHVENFDA